MHRIDWTLQLGSASEHFTVSTDGSVEDAIELMVKVRWNVERERDEQAKQLLSAAADALGKLAEHI